MGRLTVKGVDEALREAMGNQAAVARKFGVTRQAVASYIERHAVLQQAQRDIDEAMLDNAESALYRDVLAGNFQAVKWYLATKGK